MSFKKLKPYLISIVIALAAGGIGGFITYRGLPAYEVLVKPPLTPPFWLFPIVWCILYILMGISAAMVWKSSKQWNYALSVYATQLVVNVLWSVFHFGMEQYLLSFIWLIFLWVVIILMIIAFRSINKTAAWLQIPYLLWTTFAAYLNFGIWMLNK